MIVRKIKDLETKWAQADRNALGVIEKKIRELLRGAIAETLYNTQSPNPRYYTREYQLYSMIKTELVPIHGTAGKAIGYILKIYLDFNAMQPKTFSHRTDLLIPGLLAVKGRRVYNHEMLGKTEKPYRINMERVKNPKGPYSYNQLQKGWKESPQYYSEAHRTINGYDMRGEAYAMTNPAPNPKYRIAYSGGLHNKYGYRMKEMHSKRLGRLNEFADFNGNPEWHGKPLTYWIPYWLQFAKPWNGRQRYKDKNGERYPIIGIRFRHTGFFTKFISKVEKADLSKIYMDELRKQGVRVIQGKAVIGAWHKNIGYTPRNLPAQTIFGRR